VYALDSKTEKTDHIRFRHCWRDFQIYLTAMRCGQAQ